MRSRHPLSPRGTRARAHRRLGWLRQAAAAGTLTLAMLHGAPDAQAQVAADPAGGEFQVHTFTTGDQDRTSVAIDDDGDFVIAWTSYAQDGDGDGVYAQRYAADGTPQGSEFRVNSETSGDQEFPSVGIDADGNFVIAWTSDGQDGSGYGIYAQRYAADGTLQGSEFRVNTFTTNNQSLASVALDDDGDFVIAWRGNGQDDPNDNTLGNVGVFAQRYAADGTPQGSEFQVNTFITGLQTQPSVAIDADGDFVIAWQGDGQDGSVFGVFAQRYAADGTPRGGEFQVNVETANAQDDPSVGMDADGNFIITWDSLNQDGDTDGIYARRYAADGTPLSSEFRVNTFTTDRQNLPAVSLNDDGDFVVVWQSNGQDDPDGDSRQELGIFGQRYLADGTPDGDEFQVNTFVSESQNNPAVAANADGDFVVAWQSGAAGGGPTQDTDGNGVYAQRYVLPDAPVDPAPRGFIAGEATLLGHLRFEAQGEPACPDHFSFDDGSATVSEAGCIGVTASGSTNPEVNATASGIGVFEDGKDGFFSALTIEGDEALRFDALGDFNFSGARLALRFDARRGGAVTVRYFLDGDEVASETRAFRKRTGKGLFTEAACFDGLSIEAANAETAVSVRFVSRTVNSTAFETATCDASANQRQVAQASSEAALPTDTAASASSA
ncbi:MAG: hypothetical protein AAF624_00775, partial [Bacteroidota bacterium]